MCTGKLAPELIADTDFTFRTAKLPCNVFHRWLKTAQLLPYSVVTAGKRVVLGLEQDNMQHVHLHVNILSGFVANGTCRSVKDLLSSVPGFNQVVTLPDALAKFLPQMQW